MSAGHDRFESVAAIPVDRNSGRVYEMGWQSWSPTAVYPVTATSARPSAPYFQIFYRPETPAPADGFQAEGVLAVAPADGEPVHLFTPSGPPHQVPSIRARLVGDVLTVSANGPVRHTSARADLYGALAGFADEHVASQPARPLRPVPPVWASWYQYFTDFTQQDLTDNLDAMDRLGLPIGVVRIDDAFQAGIGDWLTPSARFDSLPGMITAVTDRGRRAGVWFAPFLVGADSTLLRAHPEWLVRDAAGTPVRALHNWDQDCFVLDTTHPGAAAHLHHVFATYREWGTDYFMIDFLYAGAMPGRRHDGADPITAYRAGLALIRDAIGADATLQGCGAPMLPSVGYVDTMRVGADIAAHYPALHDDLANPGGEAAPVSTIARAFTHGRFWLNDPDCLLARPGVQRRQQWAELVERYGAVRISSDGLDRLDDWGLAVTRRLLVPSRVEPFAADQVPLELPVVQEALRGRDAPDRPGGRDFVASLPAGGRP